MSAGSDEMLKCLDREGYIELLEKMLNKEYDVEKLRILCVLVHDYLGTEY